MSARVLAVVVALMAGAAAAEPVAVKVIDVAGDDILVEPGEAAGLRAGTRVTIGGAVYAVEDVNERTAVVRRPPPGFAGADRGGGGAPALGAAGTAEVVAPVAPRARDAYREQWPPPVPPARGASVDAVPIEAGRGARVTIIASGVAAGGGGVQATGELRALIEAPRVAAIAERAVGAELDVAARAYSAGWNRAERAPIRVRAAAVRWGEADDPVIAIGRLRYAASVVGTLDGVRVRARRGALELAAFGGASPDPLGGEPEAAARFGGEAVWTAPGAWEPRVAVTAHASTWDGRLDERRAAVVASAGRGGVWLDGWAEAQAFPDDNPFDAAAVELTAAGASAAWRGRRGGGGLSVAMLRPERSLRLAAALPLDWICLRDVGERCAGGDRTVAATANGGVRGAGWQVDAIGTAGHTRGIAAARAADGSLYVRGELRGRGWRAFVAPSAAFTSFADAYASELGAGVVRRTFDASLAYRPERLIERGGDAVTVHGVLAEARAAIAPSIDAALAAMASLGSGHETVAAIATIVYRAR